MAVWAVAIGAAVGATSATMGIIKGRNASSQAAAAAQLDAGARVAEGEEGLVDALFASMQEGGAAMMEAGNQAIMAFIQALGIQVR